MCTSPIWLATTVAFLARADLVAGHRLVGGWRLEPFVAAIGQPAAQ